MKVLLLSPKIPLSYWTFGELCRFGGRKALIPPLGLITVAALLPPDWEFRLVDLNIRDLREDDWHWAELVMISGMIFQGPNMLALIREAKQRGKTVVVGGPFPTSLPEEVLAAGSDFLVRGEAENSLALLIQALKEGRLGGVFENKDKPDLSLSPVPRFDLLDIEGYGAISIQASRGCPFDCEFCDVVSLYGRKMRYKKPRQVLAELTAIYRLGWRHEVFICDDNFIGNPAQARRILEALIPWMKDQGQPFNFWTQTSINLGHDREVIDLMTQANFSTVFIGIESPDEDILAHTGKHQNLRHPLAESLNNIRDNGLNIIGSFVIGFDGEKPGVGERICSLVEATKIPMVMLNLLQPLPNTRLWRRLKEEGRLLDEKGGSGVGDLDYGRAIFLPTRPVSQIAAEYQGMWDELYEPSHYLSRAYDYCVAMRPTRRALALSRGQPLPNSPRRNARPLKESFKDFVRFLRLTWRQGVRARYRAQYWRQLLDLRRRNPSRLVKYLSLCIMGEDMFLLRETVRQRMAALKANAEPRPGRKD